MRYASSGIDVFNSGTKSSGHFLYLNSGTEFTRYGWFIIQAKPNNLSSIHPTRPNLLLGTGRGGFMSGTALEIIHPRCNWELLLGWPVPVPDTKPPRPVPRLSKLE